MGQAGRALRQVLENHEISQYKLAEVMNIERNNISRWVREVRDPTADKVVDVVRALRTISYDAAKEFVMLYLGQELE